MTTYSIGSAGDAFYRGEDDAQADVELVRVVADSMDSPVTRIINVGSDMFYDAAHKQQERLERDPTRDEYSVPSPRNIAAGIVGQGATLNEVLGDDQDEDSDPNDADDRAGRMR